MIKSIHITEKTLSCVTTTYGMNKIKDVVKEVIWNCEVCQKSKTVTTATKEKTIHVTVIESFDVCGPFRESVRKKEICSSNGG